MCEEGSTFELEIDKKGNVIDTLLTSRQFSKDQESFPSLATLCDAHTLDDGSERLKIALRHASRSDDLNCPDPSIY
jgi:hypothetical protein